MRAAALAIATFGAFIGVMYLRFSGDAVPEPPPKPSAGASVVGNCFIARVVGAPETTPLPADAPPTAVPCSTVSASDPSNPRVGLQPPPPSLSPPEVLAGIDVIPLENGPDIELPANVALIIETGCDCDIPRTGLTRVYRDSSQAIRIDDLFSVDRLGLGPRLTQTANGGQEGQPYITGFAVDPEATEIVVSVCVAGSCGEWWSPDSVIALFRSTDGGVTWVNLGELPHRGRVLALLGGGSVLLSLYESQGSPPVFETFPEGSRITAPEWRLSQPVAWPQYVMNGEIIWQSSASDGGPDGRLLRSDGSVFLDLGAGASPLDMLSSANGDELSVLWSQYQPLSGLHARFVLGLLTPERSVFRAYSAAAFFRVGAWLDADTLVGNSDRDYSVPGDYVPSLIDLRSGEIRRMTNPFVKPPFQNGRNDIPAVQQGPFARVVNTDNTCLNIRAGVAVDIRGELVDSQILDCAAERVLLTDLLDTSVVEGVTLVHVRTPAGIEGWANAQYLER